MDYIVLALLVVLGSVSLLAAKHATAPRPARRGRIPAHWEQNPRFAGPRLWAELGMRCPELLGVAGDRILGGPVVDYLLKTQRLAEHEPACQTRGTTIPWTEPEEDPKPAVFFKPGEPTTLAEYPGQPHITNYLSALVSGTEATCWMPREHQLFMGTAGQGKTLLAKCFANDLRLRNERLGLPAVQFIEGVPSDMETAAQQDAVLRQCLGDPTVLFIDELHALTASHALKLYALLEEGRYKFEDDADFTQFEDLLIVGATTDYGALHAAVKRRFNRHMLEPLSADALADILGRQPYPIEAEGVQTIVARTHFSGAPWEALQLYRQARVYARARGVAVIEVQDVEQALTAQAIDTLGLARMDRRVIEVLLRHPRYRRGRGTGPQEFVCYGASETDVVSMAGIDRGEYRDVIKPKLMSRGLLQVRPTYGQALTARAVAHYRGLVRD